MAAALNIVLSMCLLHGVLSAEFQVFMPNRIEAVAGSCVTIPCSFEIEDAHESNLDDTCVAIWKKDGLTDGHDVTSIFQTTPTTGDLKNKICTSTLRNTEIADSGTYYFRVQCNLLKYNFVRGVIIAVEADPPKPTLSLSELVVEEGASVTLQCSAPAPCPSLSPNVTWTPTLGPVEQTLIEEQDKTKVLISVVTFTASHLHHGQTFNCTAVYSRPDQSSVSSVSPGLTAHVQYQPKDTRVSVHPSGPVREGTNVNLTCSSDANPPVKMYTWYRPGPEHPTLIHTGPGLTIKVSRNTGAFLCKAENDVGTGWSNKTNIDVQFAPQILSSSNCSHAAATVSCSCYTVGNPSPTLQWYLNGLSVHISDKVDIISESLNGTSLRSIITVKVLQGLDLPTLLCHSSNSVGSTRRQFYFLTLEDQTGHIMLPVFASTVAILLILVCVLLFVIRSLKTRPTHPGTVSMNQLLDGNDEVSNATEKNTNPLSHEWTLGETRSISMLDNTHGDGQRSAEKKQEDSEVIYSTVVWKSKKKRKENGGDAFPSCSSHLEERCKMGNVRKDFISNAVDMGNQYDDREPKIVKREMECEYAQVKYKDKSANEK